MPDVHVRQGADRCWQLSQRCRPCSCHRNSGVTLRSQALHVQQNLATVRPLSGHQKCCLLMSPAAVHPGGPRQMGGSHCRVQPAGRSLPHASRVAAAQASHCIAVGAADMLNAAWRIQCTCSWLPLGLLSVGQALPSRCQLAKHLSRWRARVLLTLSVGLHSKHHQHRPHISASKLSCFEILQLSAVLWLLMVSGDSCMSKNYD